MEITFFHDTFDSIIIVRGGGVETFRSVYFFFLLTVFLLTFLLTFFQLSFFFSWLFPRWPLFLGKKMSVFFLLPFFWLTFIPRKISQFIFFWLTFSGIQFFMVDSSRVAITLSLQQFLSLGLISCNQHSVT